MEEQHTSPAEFAFGPSRREFLSWMGTSFALSGMLYGLSGCSSAPPEKIVPYVRAPEDLVPGKAQFYATAMPFSGYGIGLIAQSNLGRPIKVDGNPYHPASLGASNAIAQSSVLDLYDPDRAQAITSSGTIHTWHSFASALAMELDAARANSGARIRILTETVTSPTLAWQIGRFLSMYPQARWVSYEPFGNDNEREGARMAFGMELETQLRIQNANVVLSLDSDFLLQGPAHIRQSKDFSNRRRVSAATDPMSRLYVAESNMTITGAMADHRFPVSSTEIDGIARAIANRLNIAEIPLAESAKWPWLDTVLADLRKEGRNSLIVVGHHQPAPVHALVHAINVRLGNIGNTIVFSDPVAAHLGSQLDSLKMLADEMKSGQVDALIVIGGNPVYTAPADLEFSQQLDKVRFKAHLGLYADETTARCQWHIPETHFLESWGDLRAFDGTASIIQPLINPLIEGKSAVEFMSALLGDSTPSGYEIVRGYWQQHLDDFETSWQQSVRDGIVIGSAAPLRSVRLRKDFRLPEPPSTTMSTPASLEVVFRADPSVFDGRYSNNGWLQELPKPLTKLTWDNAALISPERAKQLNCVNGDVVEIRIGTRAVRAPVWIQPGHASSSLTVFLGYGRTHAGQTGNGHGYNAYAVRESNAPWIAPSATIQKTGERVSLACTQNHQNMEGRENVRVATIADFGRNPSFANLKEFEAQSLYPSYPQTEYAWGMSIDLSTCIGCNACVTACQAENNIPVVGKQEVERSREMHWLRIDTYFEGPPENPKSLLQPVPCMHCEDAPCEVVCPVGATTHSSEGLNEMTYNRCVGTRYCSNNCPYKVRRFNFFGYSDFESASVKLAANPDVTVRSRGVMEKCTYCVQRINRARITAEKEDRSIRDGEVVTACQAACPADAIVFGNIRDGNSQVSKLKSQPRNYALLAELNTRPRTMYLAKLSNPNPEMGRSQ